MKCDIAHSQSSAAKVWRCSGKIRNVTFVRCSTLKIIKILLGNRVIQKNLNWALFTDTARTHFLQ